MGLSLAQLKPVEIDCQALSGDLRQNTPGTLNVLLSRVGG